MKPRVSARAKFLAVAISVLLLGSFAWAGTEQVLHTFTIADGEYPYAGVIFDGSGNLYGTTFYGGSTACNGAGCGVVFKLAPAAGGGWTESTIYTFKGLADGNHPYSPLIFDAAGNLYGTTYGDYDGGSGFGTAYRLSPNSDGSWRFSLLHTFGIGNDGMQPNGPIAFDSLGNLYGATFTGGTSSIGTVFEISPAANGSWKEAVLHSFVGGKDGAYPSSGVVVRNGMVYGTTESGGIGCATGCGVVFEFSPNSDGTWKESFPRRFTGGIDGYLPYGLLFDSSGNLYGAAAGGNKAYCDSGCGLVFRMTEKLDGVWADTVLHNFNGGNGQAPEALIFGADGDLYGATGGGGLGAGLVFDLNPDATWAETVIYEFEGGSDGYQPTPPMIFDNAGNLYGTALHGGASDVGVVFEVTP
jgi:uncharacterized repeat protein (TIGR03803 family)